MVEDRLEQSITRAVHWVAGDLNNFNQIGQEKKATPKGNFG
jgi:hypothetical protein